MSERVVEMIEALQKEWRECAKSQVPRAYADRGMEDKYLKLDNWASGMDEAANDLAPILAAARAQGQELAAMKEPMECGHPKAFLVSENTGAQIAAEQIIGALTEGGKFAEGSPLEKVMQAIERIKREARLEGQIIEAKRQPHEDTYEGSCGVHMPRFCSTCRRIAALSGKEPEHD